MAPAEQRPGDVTQATCCSFPPGPGSHPPPPHHGHCPLQPGPGVARGAVGTRGARASVTWWRRVAGLGFLGEARSLHLSGTRSNSRENEGVGKEAFGRFLPTPAGAPRMWVEVDLSQKLRTRAAGPQLGRGEGPEDPPPAASCALIGTDAVNQGRQAGGDNFQRPPPPAASGKVADGDPPVTEARDAAPTKRLV